MKKRLQAGRLLAILLLCIAPAWALRAQQDVETMRSMAQRLMGDKAAGIEFVQTGAADDSFTLYSKKGKVFIEGNNANSMAVGLNYYLKNYCMTTVSWFATDPVTVPDVLPQVKKKVSVKARVPMRFFLNYCTFGYTMPWWKWKDWERFIDWMALNGINMPLAITGQESVWYNVWKKFGLSDEEIRNFFTGPAFLPWHRMCNFDGWMGPLPMSWLESQEELQKQIVKREREFNMKPILPAFSGHIPYALTEHYPEIKATPVDAWGGFSLKYNCTFLSPSEPMFYDIQKAFLEEQTRLYGTDHIYGSDSFNEVDPPSWEEEDIASMTKNIYNSMAAVDPDAHWLEMAWLFYISKSWTPSRVQAMMDAVPEGKLIMLDYYCERDEIWKIRDSFNGQPFIWCYLGNFGGNTICMSPFKTTSKHIDDVYAHGRSNFAGLGATLEGMGVNQYAYEFVLDKAWAMPMSDKEWIEHLADRRYGSYNEEVRSVWRHLYDETFTMTSGDSQGTMIEMPPTMNVTDHFKDWKVLKMQYFNDFTDAWRKLCEQPASSHDAYLFDIVNFGRQSMGMLFQSVYEEFAAAFKRNDVAALRQHGSRMMEIIADTDTLLALHPQFSFRSWNEEARAFGINEYERNYYEENARMLVTRWGENGPRDYARRGWSGLIGNYYAVRWQKFIDIAIECSEKGQPFDQAKYDSWHNKFVNNFSSTKNRLNYVDGSDIDAREYSLKLLEKYYR